MPKHNRKKTHHRTRKYNYGYTASKTLSLVGILILVVAVFFTVLILKQQQELRQRAQTTYSIQYSTSSNRSNPVLLQEMTISGNAYIFVTPTTGISNVKFYLDDPNRTGTPYQTENLAPFDFEGDQNGLALPFDTTKVSNSSHTITAAITLSTGAVTVLNATFTVANNVVNLIRNPSFETGFSPWALRVNSNAAGSVSQDSTTKVDGTYSEKLTVTISSSSSWYLQLWQAPVAVASGKTYTISFYAKASSSRPLQMVWQQNVSPYTVYWSQTPTISTSWQQYTYTFNSNVNDSGAFVAFNFASSTATAWIDNVKISTGGSLGVSPTPIGQPSPTPSKTRSFKPSSCSDSTNTAINRTADKYNLPRWFLYAIAMRESSCNPNAFNSSNNGYGLMQLTTSKHNGMPYPMNLSTCNNTNQNWIYDMGINIFGEWVKMCNVTRLDNRYDAQQNADRFATVHAIGWFLYEKNTRHPSESHKTRLERVAFYWCNGYPYRSESYPNSDGCNYLPQYRSYVDSYKPKVEAEDGVWDGNPHW